MEYKEEISGYVIRANEYLRSLFLEITPLHRSEQNNINEVIIVLFCTLYNTSESIMQLLLCERLHDADVLFRTVMEGTIKYCYLMEGTNEERKIKYDEYKVNLTEIDKISDHKKAVETIKILNKYSDNSTIPFESYLLPDSILDKLEKKYPKKIKDKVKRKWSYRSMLESIARDNAAYELLLGTLSTYSLTSHLCHFDWVGLSHRNTLILSAYSEENIKSQVLYALRILSNTISMFLIRVGVYMRVCYVESTVRSLFHEINDYVIYLNKISNNGLLEICKENKIRDI